MLSSVNQIQLDNKRQQELCSSKQSFYKSQETINFYISLSYKQVYIYIKGHNAVGLGRFRIAVHL